MLCFRSLSDLAMWMETEALGRQFLKDWVRRCVPLLAVQYADHVDLFAEDYFDVMIVTAIHDLPPSWQDADVEQKAGRRADLFWPGRASDKGPGLIASLVQRKLEVHEMLLYQSMERHRGLTTRGPRNTREIAPGICTQASGDQGQIQKDRADREHENAHRGNSQGLRQTG